MEGLKITREVEMGETGQKVKLEKIRGIALNYLKASDIGYLVDDVEISAHANFLADEIVMRTRFYVWGESLGWKTIRHPLNWIEAVKERWLPWRLRRRWPVRYQVHHVEAKAYYPGLRPSLPDEPWRIVAYMGSEEERAGD